MDNTQNIYAGFWKRVFAFYIDAIILFPLGILNKIALPKEIAFGDFSEVNIGFAVPLLIISSMIHIVYKCGLESSPWQATIGKKIMGIKVTDSDFNRINLLTAIIRNFWLLLSLFVNPAIVLFHTLTPLFALSFIYSISCLMTAFTGKKQATHDMIAHCLVVNKSYLENAENGLSAPILAVRPAVKYPEGFDGDGLTPLMRAVYDENITAVQNILKENPAILNKTRPDTGVSAFWMAAAYGNVSIIKILLASGADTSNTNKEGLRAVDIARKMGH
ncbi:MAG: RDD family protein, partial [Elusimicrobiota bacterium]|nr:RDD family protein [Elusimicrobiota bacterium]